MIDFDKIVYGGTQKSKNNNPASVQPTGSASPQQGNVSAPAWWGIGSNVSAQAWWGVGSNVSAPAWWGVGKVVLGVVLAGVVVSYYVLLETTCSSTDPNEGAGELVITRGGSAKGTRTGERFLAPPFPNAGARLPANGTDEGEILWIEDLCEAVLDCSMCPPVFRLGFNESSLHGKMLIYNWYTRGEIYLCGLNPVARVFGRTGLVGMGSSTQDGEPSISVPGLHPKIYRSGEYRDAKLRDGDMGIPFPHFDANSYDFSKVLFGISESAPVRAVVTPTAPNPWRSMFCGVWKPLATLLILGHIYVAEQAMSNHIGHVVTSGLRLDLAQLALATESVAHFLMAVLHHDPLFSFHWGALPLGGYSAMLFGSIVLTCSSTLLLAAFWCVPIEEGVLNEDGLSHHHRS